KFIGFARKTYAMEEDGVTSVTFCGISTKAIAELYPKGVKVEDLKLDMQKGIIFKVLQGTRTRSGMIIKEEQKTKKWISKKKMKETGEHIIDMEETDEYADVF